MDQGIGVGVEILGKDLYLGVERMSTDGGFSWGPWQSYGSYDKYSLDDGGITVGFEVGLGGGAEATINHAEGLIPNRDTPCVR
jgi:hypothetical protein